MFALNSPTCVGKSFAKLNDESVVFGLGVAVDSVFVTDDVLVKLELELVVDGFTKSKGKC